MFFALQDKSSKNALKKRGPKNLGYKSRNICKMVMFKVAVPIETQKQVTYGIIFSKNHISVAIYPIYTKFHWDQAEHS